MLIYLPEYLVKKNVAAGGRKEVLVIASRGEYGRIGKYLTVSQIGSELLRGAI